MKIKDSEAAHIKKCTEYIKINSNERKNLEIKLPEEVEKVVLTNDVLNRATISNANGLELNTIEYNEETKTIKVELNGKQTEYINNVAKNNEIKKLGDSNEPKK